MTKFNKAILESAGSYLGTQEWPGAKHNPAILAMFAAVGAAVDDDETSWCAAFVGSVLASLGLPHTGKLNARSYQTYGQAVRTQDAQPGDIVVLWRDSPQSWKGHVAFFVRFEDGKVILRGGNQRDGKVTDQGYPIDRVLSIRRVDGASAPAGRPILRSGDKGAFVLDLQSNLIRLGYTVGKKDGVYGSRTLAAVVAFQNDNHLTADGVTGQKTWEALVSVATPHRADRKVDVPELRSRSRTMKAASEGMTITAATGGVVAAGAALGAVEQAVEVAQRAGGLLQVVGASGPWVIGILLIGVVGFLLYQRFSRIEAARIDDARTGANDRV